MSEDSRNRKQVAHGRYGQEAARAQREADAAIRRLQRVNLWECEDCGWNCAPNPSIPLEEAECDNCGGELAPVAS